MIHMALERSRIVPIAVSAGILAGGVTVAWLCPRLLPNSLSILEALRVGVVLLAFVFAAASAVSSLAFTLLSGRADQEVRRIAFATAGIAVWCVPALVFLAASSVWTIVSAIVLTGAAALFLRSQLPGRQVTVPDWTPPRNLFEPPETPPAAKRLSGALLTAIMLEGGIGLALGGRLLEAALLLSVGTGVVLWRLGGARVRPILKPPRGAWKSVLTLAFAILFTFSGLSLFLRTDADGGRWSDLIRRRTGDDDSGARARAAKGSLDVGGDFTGVILFPKPKPHMMLVPPLPSLAKGLSDSRAEPLSIPFFGVYWFFKRPDTRPPVTSFLTNGTPTDVTFRAVDHRPLSMEAHQSLGTLFDLSCCSAIEMAIRNADRYPATVGVELVLVNTSASGTPYQSLGVLNVNSTPPRPAQGDQTSYSETLRFPVPQTPVIKQFNELTIRFVLNLVRADRSARIAIEKFVLVPRTI